MRRVPLGAAAVVCVVGLLGLTGCSSNAGAATNTQADTAPSAAPSAAPEKKVAASPLAGLAVVPAGYLKGASQDPNQHNGPFDRDSYLNTLSASPAEDLALLLNASFTEGYQAYRISPDRRKRFTVQLFKAGSKGRAQILQQGFWSQDEHGKAFAVPGVPGALIDARVVPASAAGQVEAVAQASLVVGAMVAEIRVSQTGPVENTPIPDTKLITTLVKQQHDRLTTNSG